MGDKGEEKKLAGAKNRCVRHVHRFMDKMSMASTMHYTDFSRPKDEGAYIVFYMLERVDHKGRWRNPEKFLLCDAVIHRKR